MRRVFILLAVALVFLFVSRNDETPVRGEKKLVTIFNPKIPFLSTPEML